MGCRREGCESYYGCLFWAVGYCSVFRSRERGKRGKEGRWKMEVKRAEGVGLRSGYKFRGCAVWEDLFLYSSCVQSKVLRCSFVRTVTALLEAGTLFNLPYLSCKTGIASIVLLGALYPSYLQYYTQIFQSVVSLAFRLSFKAFSFRQAQQFEIYNRVPTTNIESVD